MRSMTTLRLPVAFPANVPRPFAPMPLAPMKFVAILLVLGVPMLELGLLIKAGQLLGFWSMLAIIIGTGVLGAAIISHEGLSAPLKAQQAMARGEPPVPEMFDSALAVAGGVLLVTPGLIADGLGLALQVPLVRRVVGRWLMRRFFNIEDVTVERRPGRGPRGEAGRGPNPDLRRGERAPPGDGPVIEGEYQRIVERPADPKRPRPNGVDRT